MGLWSLGSVALIMTDIIITHLKEYLWTNDNHFGFKSGHSTDLCTKAITEYFNRRSTSVYMYVAFLDASKSIDIGHYLRNSFIDMFLCIYMYIYMPFCATVSTPRDGCKMVSL